MRKQSIGGAKRDIVFYWKELGDALPRSVTPLAMLLRSSFNTSTLTFKFVALSVWLIVTALIGNSYLAMRVQENTVRQAGIGSLSYVEGLLAEWVHNQNSPDVINTAAASELSRFLLDNSKGRRFDIVAIRARSGDYIYGASYVMAGYGTGAGLTNSSFLDAIFWGKPTVALIQMPDKSGINGTLTANNLLQFIVPVLSKDGSRVVAVVELYRIADDLAESVQSARVMVALATGLSALFSILILYVIFWNRITLDARRDEIGEQQKKLAQLRATQQGLRRQLVEADERIFKSQQRLLGVGADIHDGPVQLLSLALMEYQSLEAPLNHAERGESLCGARFKSYLTEALSEMRDMAGGKTPPAADGATLRGILASAVSQHERLTGMHTDIEIREPFTFDMPQAVSRCVYQFLREGLMNTFRHAAGKGVKISVLVRNGRLILTIQDKGPGFDLSDLNKGRLGLQMVKARVASAGGVFSIESKPGAGASISVSFDATAKGVSGE